MVQFNPTFLLKNKHLQTVYATFFRKPIQLATTCEVFELGDGDFVDCYWLNKPDQGSATPIVVLFHGLEGSHKSPYIQGAMQTLMEGGYACVLMHFRGCSGRDNRLPKTYHSGQTSDAKAWIEHIKKTFPNAPLFAVGYSLGANMLLKLLGEYEHNSPLKAAIAISAPMQLDISADAISHGSSRLYESHLLRSLKATLLQKYKQHDMEALLGKSPEQIQRISTIREFDDIYTSKINGFYGAQDYYIKNSAKQFLPNIKTNTLIIHALDDPFMTPSVLPEQNNAFNGIASNIEMEIHQHGGHVGFVMSSVFKPIYYMEHRILGYFNQQRSQLATKPK
ncbi:hydrolase [Marinomonas colpomeniae]|uniref:Hydrolase n=1 Tax=Marinomonas colpomeniae TaxID=2774408 RepID=A0ABR8NXC6_9GAMM|nr:hydrolase [Marinomonas colpomeniae]MBD5770154.1 hydrolase [Marinomonas colpomeniae]